MVFGSDHSSFRRCLVLNVLSSELRSAQTALSAEWCLIHTGLSSEWCLIHTGLSSEWCFWLRLVGVQKVLRSG